MKNLKSSLGIFNLLTEVTNIVSEIRNFGSTKPQVLEHGHLQCHQHGMRLSISIFLNPIAAYVQHCRRK